MGFLLNFSLKSHLLFFFFDKKHKSTDWCSIEGGVPSDGENRVHCLYFAVFTYVQLAARFPIGNCHLFAWNRNRNRHFFSGIPESRNPVVSESRNPSGVSRIPATFFPGILLESATFFSGILVESATFFPGIPVESATFFSVIPGIP